MPPRRQGTSGQSAVRSALQHTPLFQTRVRAAGQGEQMVSEAELVPRPHCTGPIMLADCFLGRLGEAAGRAGRVGSPQHPFLRNGAHSCTCTHTPNTSMHNLPLPPGKGRVSISPAASQTQQGRNPYGGLSTAPEPLTLLASPLGSQVPRYPTLGPTSCHQDTGGGSPGQGGGKAEGAEACWCQIPGSRAA